MADRLNDLRGLRSAPQLTAAQRTNLRLELSDRLEACDWFTIGVMAPSSSVALNALQRCQQALGWKPLELDPASPRPEDVAGATFIKGNQNTGRFQLRPESGLGEGVLITGHSLADPDAEDTWGPLPLTFFD